MSHRLQRFTLQLYVHNVTASLGWFDKFRKRNELKNVTMLGEAASAPKFFFFFPVQMSLLSPASFLTICFERRAVNMLHLY
jgi:hypothetical protein